jgi:nitrite reductase/ring-hydroxylating ferredoxin subunit
MADGSLNDAERFERYVEALLEGRRPSPDDIADAEEAAMARLAGGLVGVTHPDAEEPDPAFIEQLRLRMRDADEGIISMASRPAPTASPAAARGRMRISRRDLLRAGVGAAAGLAAGFAGGALLAGERQPDDPWAALVGRNGEWVEVATLGAVPPGAAVRFSAGALEGFIVNVEGEIRALSAICTHRACTLVFRERWGDLRCPCHGASFDLEGRLANGSDRWNARGYADDERAYPLRLRPLDRPQLRVDGERILVWTARG